MLARHGVAPEAGAHRQVAARHLLRRVGHHLGRGDGHDLPDAVGQRHQLQLHLAVGAGAHPERLLELVVQLADATRRATASSTSSGPRTRSATSTTGRRWALLPAGRHRARPWTPPQNFESGSGGTLGGGIGQASKAPQKGPFCPGVAVKSTPNELSSPGPTSQYPASNRFLQLDDIDLSSTATAAAATASSSYDFSSAPATHTQGSRTATATSRSPATRWCRARRRAGNLVYLGSLNSWHGGSSNKDGGLHIMYNTLVAGGDGGSTNSPPPSCTRSSSVAELVTLASGSHRRTPSTSAPSTGACPSSGTALGNTLYQADPADLPVHHRPLPRVQAGRHVHRDDYDVEHADLQHQRREQPVQLGRGDQDEAVRASATSTSAPARRHLLARHGVDAQGDRHHDTYIATNLDNKLGGVDDGILGGIDWSTAAIIEARVDVGQHQEPPDHRLRRARATACCTRSASARHRLDHCYGSERPAKRSGPSSRRHEGEDGPRLQRRHQHGLVASSTSAAPSASPT